VTKPGFFMFILSGCLTLLQIYSNYFFLLEIYKVSWKFSGLVCEFACLWLILVTLQYKISRGKPESIDIEVSNLDSR